jgi:putative acetyltransferase
MIHLPDWAPPEAAQIYRLRNYDPAIRGQVVYPPAFDAATAASASLP